MKLRQAWLFFLLLSFGCSGAPKVETDAVPRLTIVVDGIKGVPVTPDEAISYIVVSVTNSGASPAKIYTGVRIDPPYTLASSTVGYQIRSGSYWWECFILNDDSAFEFILAPGVTEVFLVPAYPFMNDTTNEKQKRLRLSYFLSDPFTSLIEVP